MNKVLLVSLVLVFLNGCAGLTPGTQRPEVNLTSFALAPDGTGGPHFNIGLQVINPNRDPLTLAGITYSIEVEGNRILSGAQNNLPVVAGYSSADIVIQASPNLLGGARLIADMLRGPGESLDYTFKARLDAGRFIPTFSVQESGSFSLARTRP